MTAIVAVLPLLVPAAVLFGLFVMFERSDRSPATVAVVWAILIADSSLYASQNVVPTGLFHPATGQQSFRLVDVAVVAGLAAVAIAGRGPRRVSFAGLLWAATITWILASAALGVYNHNDTTLVSYEAKAAVYLGALLLTARVPFERYLSEGHVLRLVRVSAVIAAILIVTDKIGVRIAAGIPGLPLVDAGRLGSDAGTLFASIGIVALTMGAYAEHRARWLVPATPLIAAAFAADQRAAMLAVIASLIFLALFMKRGRLRLRITPTEMLIVLLAAVTLVLAPLLIVYEAGGTPAVPYVPELTLTLYGRAKVLSAEERINQLRAARTLIEQRPIFGWGLGVEFVYYRTGLADFEKTNLTHDILVDLWVRAGIVGLALFLAAVIATVASGTRVWRAERDPAFGGLLLGSLAVVVGLIPKGLVENLFEKYRMVLLLGLMIGMVSSGAVARPDAAARRRAAPGRKPRPNQLPGAGGSEATRTVPLARATP